MPRHILIIGDHDHGDFAAAVEWLRRRAEATCVCDAAPAAKLADTADLILFTQARPGRFRQSDVELVHAAAPLARLAVLLGAWCEGEMRTGAPLNGVMRIYWHEWEAKLAPLWEPAENAAWSLPRTSLAAERTLAASAAPQPRTRELVAICPLGAASYSSLADALQAAGFAAVWIDPRQPFRARPAALVWEGELRMPGRREELASLCEAFRPAPAIVLASFLRREDLRLARAAGAADVVGKPYVVADLVRRLRMAIEST
jgi:CheY-like chemotaxis protein